MNVKKLYESVDDNEFTASNEDKVAAEQHDPKNVPNMLTAKEKELITFRNGLINFAENITLNGIVNNYEKEQHVKLNSESLIKFAETLDNAIEVIPEYINGKRAITFKDVVFAKESDNLVAAKYYDLLVLLEQNVDNFTKATNKYFKKADSKSLAGFMSEIPTLTTFLESLLKRLDLFKTAVKSAKSTVAHTPAAEKDTKKGKNKNWLDIILTAQQEGLEQEAWEDYYTEVWGDGAEIIKGLGKPFQVEAFAFGLTPFSMKKGRGIGNPFVTFLSILKTDYPEAFKKLNYNNYVFIHNAAVSKDLTNYDIAAVKVTALAHKSALGVQNIIYAEDFYNYRGTDLKELLRFQDKLLSTATLAGKDTIILKNLYEDKDYTKVINPKIILKKIYELGLDDKQESTVDNMKTVINNIFKELGANDTATAKKVLKYFIDAYVLRSDNSENILNSIINNFSDKSAESIKGLADDTSLEVKADMKKKINKELNKLSLKDGNYKDISIGLAEKAGYTKKAK